MEVKFLPSAKSRLVEIWDYTEPTWGEAQADKNVRRLLEAINQEANSRHRWRLLEDEMLSGVFYLRYQRHFVFFRELSPGSIGVISVLHDNMNIPLRLREDSNQKAGE